MKDEVVLVLDCGATNVRAVAIKTDGKILAAWQEPNRTVPDPLFPGGIIWDIEAIWRKITLCIQSVVEKVEVSSIKALTLTTFGVNGAPVNGKGDLLYPVISWQCQRTIPLMEMAEQIIPFRQLYQKSGIHQYSFNTLYTLMWLKENRPDVLDRMKGFLFISSLLIHRLTGVLVNDTTMAGTSMLTNINKRSFSTGILSAFGLPNKFFELAEPGTKVGKVSKVAAEATGLPKGLPVIIGGHDTQFALIGSGAGQNEMVLSSGTWEILMTRSRQVDLGETSIAAGLTNELDVVPGIYNTGKQWLASGVIEWVKKSFFRAEVEAGERGLYSKMQDEGLQARKNPGDVVFHPDLATNEGLLSGIGLKTTRGQVYLAALRALAEKTREAKDLLEKTGGFRANALIIAGGGSRNALWNQIRANTLSIPVKCVSQPETTVLGAALVAMQTMNVFSSIEEGANALARTYETINPEEPVWPD
ncbi:MAG: L-fuculokinase [Bacteroidales bacterium]|nr:L-fuculokinase [Bacteroidales bacterium]